MKSEWESTFLGELVDVKQGLAINAKSKHLLVENGMPLLRITDLLNDKQVQFINAEEAPAQCIATKEDLIYTRTGQVGHIFRGKTGVVHNNCFRIIPKDDTTTRGYLYWFLSQERIRKYANDIASGSVQKDLNHSAFKSIPITIPSAKTQGKIEVILNALEDKIELNRKMNQTLEEIAQALFKSWFVDFAPVHARADCKSDAEIEQAAAALGVSKEVLELFPSEFVETEMGMIPEGWEIQQLPEIAEFQNGFAFYIVGYSNIGYKVVDLANVSSSGKFIETNNDKYISKEIYFLPKHEKHHLSKNDIVMAMTDMTQAMGILGKCGKILESDKYILNQRIGRIRVKKDINVNYMLTYLNSPFQINFLKNRALGTVQKYVNTTHIKEMKFVIPTTNIMEKFGSVVDPIFSKIANLDIEAAQLCKLRDTLLPRLLSGELDVSELDMETI